MTARTRRAGWTAAAMAGLLLGACGAPVQPTSSPPLAPGISPTPVPGSTSAFGGPEEAILLHSEGSGATTAFVFEIAAADGTRRPLAVVRDAFAGLAGDPEVSPPARISRRGLVAVPVMTSEAENRVVTSLLLVDLRDPGRRPIVLPVTTDSFAWGPDGRLALLQPSEVTIVEPAGGSETTVRAELVDPDATWIADGTGFVAARVPDDGPIEPGVLHLDGTFSTGPAPVYAPTGLERSASATGAVLDVISPDAPGAGDLVAHELDGSTTTWYAVDEGDGAVVDFTWDATARGIWLLLGDEGRHELAHATSPGRLGVVAGLDTPASQAVLAAVSPDDSTILVSLEPLEGEAEWSLVRIDARSGTGRPLGAGSETTVPGFVGWASLP